MAKRDFLEKAYAVTKIHASFPAPSVSDPHRTKSFDLRHDSIENKLSFRRSTTGAPEQSFLSHDEVFASLKGLDEDPQFRLVTGPILQRFPDRDLDGAQVVGEKCSQWNIEECIAALRVARTEITSNFLTEFTLPSPEFDEVRETVSVARGPNTTVFAHKAGFRFHLTCAEKSIHLFAYDPQNGSTVDVCIGIHLELEGLAFQNYFFSCLFAQIIRNLIRYGMSQGQGSNADT